MSNKLGLVVVCCLLMMVVSVSAAERTDVSMSVVTTTQPGSAIGVGDKLVYTITVVNQSQTSEVVALRSNVGGWTKSVEIAPNDSQAVVMEYSLPNTVPGGSELTVTFSGTTGGQEIAKDGDCSFVYQVNKMYSLVLDIQLRRYQITQVGEPAFYDIYITNDGNMDAKGVKITSSLEPVETVTVDLIPPNASRADTIKYVVPPATPDGEEIMNKFTLTAPNFESQTRSVSFRLDNGGEGVRTGDISVAVEAYTNPSTYAKGDRIELVVVVTNTGKQSIDYLGVKMNNSLVDARGIRNLGVQSSSILKYDFIVPNMSSTQTFTVFDASGGEVKTTSLVVGETQSGGRTQPNEIGPTWETQGTSIPPLEELTWGVSPSVTEIPLQVGEVLPVLPLEGDSSSDVTGSPSPTTVELPKTGVLDGETGTVELPETGDAPPRDFKRLMMNLGMTMIFACTSLGCIRSARKSKWWL